MRSLAISAISPKKVSIVLDLIRGKSVAEADGDFGVHPQMLPRPWCASSF